MTGLKVHIAHAAIAHALLLCRSEHANGASVWDGGINQGPHRADLLPVGAVEVAVEAAIADIEDIARCRHVGRRRRGGGSARNRATIDHPLQIDGVPRHGRTAIHGRERHVIEGAGQGRGCEIGAEVYLPGQRSRGYPARAGREVHFPQHAARCPAIADIAGCAVGRNIGGGRRIAGRPHPGITRCRIGWGNDGPKGIERIVQ